MNIRSKMNVWFAKRALHKLENTEKQLKKFETYCNKIIEWIKKDTERVNNRIKELTAEEFETFRKETGHAEMTFDEFNKEEEPETGKQEEPPHTEQAKASEGKKSKDKRRLVIAKKSRGKVRQE